MHVTDSSEVADDDDDKEDDNDDNDDDDDDEDNDDDDEGDDETSLIQCAVAVWASNASVFCNDLASSVLFTSCALVG